MLDVNPTYSVMWLEELEKELEFLKKQKEVLRAYMKYMNHLPQVNRERWNKKEKVLKLIRSEIALEDMILYFKDPLQWALNKEANKHEHTNCN